MPQFDLSKFPSQILWLFFCIFFLYFFVKLFFIPKMNEIQEKRNILISENIFSKNSSLKKREIIIKEYNEKINETMRVSKEKLKEENMNFEKRLLKEVYLMKNEYANEAKNIEIKNLFITDFSLNFLNVLNENSNKIEVSKNDNSANF